MATIYQHRFQWFYCLPIFPLSPERQRLARPSGAGGGGRGLVCLPDLRARPGSWTDIMGSLGL